VIGLVFFALLTPGTSLLLVVAGLAFIGLGFAFFSSPNTNAIMSSVDRCDFGVASGMVSTMRLIGQMLSIGIAGLIFTIIIGHERIAAGEPLMHSIQVAFVIMAALCALGVLFSLARGNLRPKANAPAAKPPIAPAIKKP